MKREKLLILMFSLIFIGSAAFGQSDDPVDTVCSGTNEYYKVMPNPGSKYKWVISKGGKATYGVDLQKDSVRIEWTPTNSMTEEFVKVVETNQFGRSGDTVILKVLKYPVPTATISGSDTLFDGNNGTDKITITLTGTPPWNVTYNDSKANVTINKIESSPYTLQTRPLSNPPLVHAFTLVSVTNQSGCQGQVSGAANITVSPPIKTSSIIHK